MNRPKLNDIYNAYVADPSAANKDALATALYFFAKAIIASKYGRRFRTLEDVIGDAALRIQNSLDTFDPERGNFAAWSTAIISNLCVDRLRNWNNSHTVSYVDELGEASASPGSRYTSKLTVQAWLKALSSDEQFLLQAKVDKRTNKDIAEALGVSVNSVYCRWYYLKRKLRTLGVDIKKGVWKVQCE